MSDDGPLPESSTPPDSPKGDKPPREARPYAADHLGDLALGALVAGAGGVVLTLPFWGTDARLFSTVLCVFVGTLLVLAGIYTGLQVLPPASKARRGLQGPLTVVLTWGMIGATIGRSLLLFVLVTSFALGFVAIGIWTLANAISATTVPDEMVTFWTSTFGLLAVGYASPWSLYLPAIAAGRWLDRDATGASETDAHTLVVLSIARFHTLRRFRQIAYVLGVLGLLVSATVATLPENQLPSWAAGLAATAQAFLVFIAVDQYLATFHPNWLDQLAAAHQRTLARALRPRRDSDLE